MLALGVLMFGFNAEDSWEWEGANWDGNGWTINGEFAEEIKVADEIVAKTVSFMKQAIEIHEVDKKENTRLPTFVRSRTIDSKVSSDMICEVLVRINNRSPGIAGAHVHLDWFLHCQRTPQWVTARSSAEPKLCAT